MSNPNIIIYNKIRVVSCRVVSCRNYRNYRNYRTYRDYRDYRNYRNYRDYRDYRDYRNYRDYKKRQNLTATSRNMTHCIGLCNPLLDISAETPLSLLEK